METMEKNTQDKNPSEYGYRFIGQPPRIRNKAEADRLAEEWYDTRSIEVRNRLIIGCRGIVGAVQSEFSPKPPLQRRDLISAGFIGVSYAVDHYEKGGNFTSYLFKAVRSSIITCLKDFNQIKIGGDVYKDARDFSEEEIEKIFASSRKLKETRLLAKKAISAKFQPLELNSDNLGVRDPISPLFKGTEKMDLTLEAIAKLDERSKVIIEGRFFWGRTLEAIGEEFGVSKAAISQNSQKALRQVRAYIEKRGLKVNYSR